jgi:hypothetical protein
MTVTTVTVSHPSEAAYKVSGQSQFATIMKQTETENGITLLTTCREKAVVWLPWVPCCFPETPRNLWFLTVRHCDSCDTSRMSQGQASSIRFFCAVLSLSTEVPVPVSSNVATLDGRHSWQVAIPRGRARSLENRTRHKGNANGKYVVRRRLADPC